MSEVIVEVPLEWLNSLEKVLEYSYENTDTLLSEHVEATIEKRPFKKNRVISEMYANEKELLAATRLKLKEILGSKKHN